jgi:hypothetical protein
VRTGRRLDLLRLAADDVPRMHGVRLGRMADAVCGRPHDAAEDEGSEEKPGRTDAGPIHGEQRGGDGVSRGLRMPGDRVGSRCRQSEQEWISESER